MRKLVLSAVCAVALIAPAAYAQEIVTIGIVTAQTGPLAAPGKFQMNGFNLAVDQINKDGGFDIAGKKYKLALKVYDTHCSASEGAAAMQRLASVDQVPIVLGELCSPVVSAEAPLAQDEKVPLIITVPTAPDLTEQNNPYLFRINAHNGQLTKALVDYIRSVDAEPLAFIAWNNDAGRGGVNSVKALLPKDFKTGYVGYFNVGEVDFSSHITNIRNSGAKAVMLLMDEEPGALAIRQIRDAGLNVQFIGTLAMGSNRFLKALNAKYLDGMVQYSAFPPNAPIDRIKKFNENYRNKFHEESHGFAAQSYDAVYVAVEAMKAAGKVSGGAAIRDALSKVTFDGVIGKISFDKKGQASPPVYITQWCNDGTRKVIFPKDMAAGCGAG
jgi:branched-chain amino acid transport system substrate-binding protein